MTERAKGPFAGKAALVTGATSGLGRHFAVLLAQGGAERLFLAGRRREQLAGTAEACAAAGLADAVAIPMDVTDAASVRAAFGTIMATCPRLDLLVNNAGVADTAPALDTLVESFDKVLDTNLRGAWLVAVEAARLMRGEGGDIVNIASILGLRVANNVAPYAISKAGVVQMTKALALEWARHGIRVNALCPGYVRTEINAGFFDSEAGGAMLKRIPMRRIGELADLDAPFTLLAGGQSRILTGAVLTVDGGHSINSL